jgi:hypothetical protein
MPISLTSKMIDLALQLVIGFLVLFVVSSRCYVAMQFLLETKLPGILFMHWSSYSLANEWHICHGWPGSAHTLLPTHRPAVCRQLRDKYNVARRDVYKPGENGEEEDNNNESNWYGQAPIHIMFVQLSVVIWSTCFPWAAAASTALDTSMGRLAFCCSCWQIGLDMMVASGLTELGELCHIAATQQLPCIVDALSLICRLFNAWLMT